MKFINQILKEKLNWKPMTESERDFVSDIYEKEECFLRMNNFPEEPLWTLFFKEESVDFDDAPSKWHITYRSEK